MKLMDRGNAYLIKFLKYRLFLRKRSFISKEYQKINNIASSGILLFLFSEPL